MECYEKSNVYSFHHAPKVGSQTDNVKILHYQELKTKDARVQFIQDWSEQYNQSQSSQYQGSLDKYTSQQSQRSPQNPTSGGYQRAKLATLVLSESNSGFTIYKAEGQNYELVHGN